MPDVLSPQKRWFLKSADDNASGSSEQPFEQALSSLGHTYLADACPRLLDYEVGFQLLDRNPENTRAVGVFGFKIGPQWAYVPVFYLNGAIKGHELLYLKSKDLFVPLSEAWVNFLLGRKPQLLGEEVGRHLGQLGVQHPSLFQLSRTPAKYASDGRPPAGAGKAPPGPDTWRQDALARWAFFSRVPISEDPAYARLRGLGEFFDKAGSAAVRALAHSLKSFPSLARDVDALYGAGSLERWAKKAVDRDGLPEVRGNSHLDGPGEHKVTTVVQGDLLPGRKVERSGQSVLYARYRGGRVEGDLRWEEMTDPEKATLLGENFVLRDLRDHEKARTSKAYDLQVDLKLDNPAETGVYKVLVRPDTFRHCLVVMQPACPRGHMGFCTVVDLQSKAWVNAMPQKVWTAGQMSDEAWREWLDTLPEAKTSGGGLQVLLLRGRQGTCPFEVEEDLGGAGEAEGVYRASFRSRPSAEGGLDTPYANPDMERRNFDTKNLSLAPQPWSSDFHTPYSVHGSRLRFLGVEGPKFVIRPGEVQVPEGSRSLSLKDSEGRPPLDVGDPAGLRLFADSHTAHFKLRRAGGTDVEVESEAGTRESLDKSSAVLRLVRQEGLAEKAARALVEDALRLGLREFRLCRAKSAGPYDPANLVEGAPGAPGFPEPPDAGDEAWSGGVAPVQWPYEVRQQVPELSGQQADRDAYNPLPQADPGALRAMVGAAQTGQREVFDTAALGSLLKATSDDNLVDQFRPDLIKGNDRIGRILFNFYWHKDRFADRYGKHDLPRIEDGLRNAFKAVGDLILDLDQREVTPSPSEDSSPADEEDSI